MNTSRSSIAPILLAILVLVSLRPVGAVDAGLDLVMTPSRVLAELTLPLRWLRHGSWERADEALASRRGEEGDAGADLVLDLRAAAEPAEPDLRLGRRLVPAEVVDRNGDLVWVALDERVGLEGLEPGEALPVVLGDAYVGRVDGIEPDRGLVRIELVTGRDFFVGAVLEEPAVPGRPPLRMTVGGLEPGSKPPRLAVHNPSERSPRDGRVQVLEPTFGQEGTMQLANGYLLGQLVAPGLLADGSGGTWSVRPPVNLVSGLFHLSILLPADTERRRDPEPLSALRDGRWIATRPLSVGDPSPGRRGLVVSTGAWDGVVPGSAVIATTRLVGRVQPGRPVAPLSARVQLLGDPGLSLNVMARLDVDGSARILGRFTSTGLVGGRPTFAWNSVLGMEDLAGLVAGPTVNATLYTGAGLEGVPAGLLIGRARLPVAPGLHDVTLESWTDGLDHRALWVRRAREGGP